MNEADFRAVLVQIRDDAKHRIVLMTQLVESLEPVDCDAVVGRCHDAVGRAVAAEGACAGAPSAARASNDQRGRARRKGRARAPEGCDHADGHPRHDGVIGIPGERPIEDARQGRDGHEEGHRPEEHDVSPDDNEGLIDESDRDDDDTFELPAPEYRQPTKTPFNAFFKKKGTRQIEAKRSTVPVGTLPWWATTKRGEMTKAAQGQQARMNASKEAKQIGARLNFT